MLRIFIGLFLAAAVAQPASAYSFFFDLEGRVTSAIEIPDEGSDYSPKIITSMINQPFDLRIFETQGPLGQTGTAYLSTDLSSVVIFTGELDYTATTRGAVITGATTITPEPNNQFIGTIGPLNFNTLTGVSTISFSVGSIHEADDNGTLNLKLSVVPLPPAFPMFGAALLALAAFAYLRRAKDREKISEPIPDCGHLSTH
jgi:hypothetical protein